MMLATQSDGFVCRTHQFFLSIFIPRNYGAKPEFYYPDWILNFNLFRNVIVSTTSSILMSVGTPTEGKLGLVREEIRKRN